MLASLCTWKDCICVSFFTVLCPVVCSLQTPGTSMVSCGTGPSQHQYSSGSHWLHQIHWHGYRVWSIRLPNDLVVSHQDFHKAIRLMTTHEVLITRVLVFFQYNQWEQIMRFVRPPTGLSLILSVLRFLKKNY